jgi:hypothetical protein
MPFSSRHCQICPSGMFLSSDRMRISDCGMEEKKTPVIGCGKTIRNLVGAYVGGEGDAVDVVFQPHAAERNIVVVRDSLYVD